MRVQVPPFPLLFIDSVFILSLSLNLYKFINLMKKRIQRFKHKLKTKYRNFKKEIQHEKTKPRSRKRDFMIGFGTMISLFGITIFGPKLAAVAKETPKSPGGTPNTPSPASTPPVDPATAQKLSGAAASICAAAISSGNFLVGAICGLIVVGGILYVQGGKK